MNKYGCDFFNKISVTEQEIEGWIIREVPHMSDKKSRRDYFECSRNLELK